MKRSKTLTMVLVIVVVLVGAVATTAGVFPGHHRRGARGFRLSGLRTFKELNLSDSQKSQLLNILEKYQRERHDTLDSLLEARKHLSTVTHAEEFNEDDVRKVHRRYLQWRRKCSCREQIMMAELRTVPNPEQIELLRVRRSQRTEKMRNRLETWLQIRSE